MPDQQYWDIADSFIQLANELAEKEPQSKVSSAMLYAVARYNAFIFAISSDNLLEEKEAAIEYFLEQYKKMLSENLDDHIQNPIK
jgi:hypothetical protein